MRLVLAIVLVLVLDPLRARADTPDAVALLPFDAEQRLEIYGHPVAAALADALGAAGLEVVFIKAKMAVPDRALLIIDGTIKAGKGTTVALTVHVRAKATATVLDTLDVTAPELTSMDRAIAEISAQLVPAVKKQLAALHEVKPPLPPKDDVTAPPPVAAPPPVVLAVVVGKSTLHDALVPELERWTNAHHRVVAAGDSEKLKQKIAPQAVAAAQAELGVMLSIDLYWLEPGVVPMGRARVHVRIADRTSVIFDRVVVTDTVVGDRGMPPAALAARVAASVLAIVDPNLRRAHSTW